MGGGGAAEIGGQREEWREGGEERGWSATKPYVAMETCLCLTDASCRSN